MSIQFTKMHGLGNDYVHISLYDQTVADPSTLARAMSDRHRGVGADGLILIAPPECPDADARMIIFNADGSRAQMCGNGIRCVAKLVYERGLARGNPLRIATDAGVLSLELTLTPNDRVASVRVDLGAPSLDPRGIPVGVDGPRVLSMPLQLPPRQGGIEPICLPMTCVSVGNPHAVFFVPDVADVPLSDWGPRIECHELFPQRINVHFVQVLTADRVRMRTWERGAGPTRACGTGASAVCVAGVLNGLTHREITAELPGGELRLAWEATTNHVFMTGPAEEVFTGCWPT